MNDNQLFVKTRYPDSFVVFHQEHRKHKVYADRVSYVALSGSFDSAGEAWADATRLIMEKELRGQA